MGKIIRYCKLTEDHVGDNAFDVSRAGILGNPYTHIKDRNTKATVKVKTRDQAIELYKEYFKTMMESQDPRSIPFQREFRKIVDAYKKYDVVYIGCYCHLNESCHGDFIIEQVIRTAVRECILERAKQTATSTPC
jgi:hypothetical protein